MNVSEKSVGAVLFCLALTGCGGGGDAVVGPDQNVKGVFDGFSGDLFFEGEGGGGEGVGDGGDGDGGVGAGGSLGQFRGVEAVVFLENGSELGRVIVNSVNGLFTIKPGRDYSDSLLIELRGRAGAQYYDEAKKAFVDFGSGQVLKARADRANRNIGVTPLTNAAAAYMDANPGVGGANVVDRIRSANQLVASAMSARLPSAYQISDVLVLPTIIGPSSGTGSALDTPADSYAIVVAGLAEMAASFNPSISSPALSISQSLAKDFTDGKIDDQQKNGDPVAPAGQESYSSAEFDGQLNSAVSRSEDEFGSPTGTREANKTINLLDADLASLSPLVEVFDDAEIAGVGPLTSTGTAVSEPSGGNPGAHLATSMSLFGGDLLVVGGIKQNYTYTPSVEGAIDNVSASADVNKIAGGTSSWFLTIEQSGKRYFELSGVDFSGTWTRVSRTGLRATDFATFGEPIVTNPDFGTGAAPLKFGFVVVNRIVGQSAVNGSGPFEINHQVDNFELTITKP